MLRVRCRILSPGPLTTGTRAEVQRINELYERHSQQSHPTSVRVCQGRHHVPKSMSNLVLVLALSVTVVPLLNSQQLPVAGTSKVAPDGKAILAYWTPERMASAKPMDLLQETRNEPTDNSPVSGPNEPVITEPSADPSVNKQVATTRRVRTISNRTCSRQGIPIRFRSPGTT